MRVAMEELLYSYGVDVVFNGHVSNANLKPIVTNINFLVVSFVIARIYSTSLPRLKKVDF